jgi:hypothetical protein
MNEPEVIRPDLAEIVAALRALCEIDYKRTDDDGPDHDDDHARTCAPGDDQGCAICKARDILNRIDYPGEAA